MYDELFDRDIAVVILSFNRPLYLKSCINSLESNVDKEKVDWIFLQDGIINKFSGKKRGTEENINMCLHRINNADLPNKRIEQNQYNLGNAIQTDKCYRRLEDDYDIIFRIECDTVLSKYFIRVGLSILDQFPETTPSLYNTGHIDDKNIPGDLNKVSENAGAFLVNIMPSYAWEDILSRWAEFRQIIRGVDWWAGDGNRPQQLLYEKFGKNSRGCDGVLETVLNEKGYKVIGPIVSRAQNIGVYGMNSDGNSFYERFGNEGELDYERDKSPDEWVMV